MSFAAALGLVAALISVRRTVSAESASVSESASSRPGLPVTTPSTLLDLNLTLFVRGIFRRTIDVESQSRYPSIIGEFMLHSCRNNEHIAGT